MTPQHPAPRWGALFDWDGVLVDSKALHRAAWDQVAREHGRPHGAAEFARHFGSQNRRVITTILAWTQDEAEVERISTRKESIYRELLGERTDLWMPGSPAFVEMLAARAVPRAIVSSSPLRNIAVVLGASALVDAFTSIVSAEDTRVGKPDPEGFLIGAARLGLPPARCVVFEDAPAGIAAGLAGGMRVVGLTTTHPASELAGAHHIVDALSPELFAEIETWF